MTPYMEMKLMAEASESNRLEVQSKLDRVTAKLDAALGREAELREELSTAQRGLANCKLALDAQTHNYGITNLRLIGAEQHLTAADERADVLFSVLNAPEYLLPGAYVTEVDVYQWFRWNGEHRPINKCHLCDVVLRNGRVLFDQSPYDFDWSYGGSVLAARHRGERE